jgi:hypothetical protein
VHGVQLVLAQDIPDLEDTRRHAEGLQLYHASCERATERAETSAGAEARLGGIAS